MPRNIYQGENAPCLNCQKRHQGCHAECNGYQEYRKRRDKDRADRDKERQIAEERYFASKRQKKGRRSL